MPTAVTIAEAAKVTKDSGRKGIMEMIQQNAPIVATLPWETTKGFAYEITREEEIPAGASRNIGGSYTASSGSLAKLSVPLKIIGGEFEIDQFLLDQGGDMDDLFARQMSLRQKSNAFHLEEMIFEGNSLVTDSAFDGLRTIIGGAQLHVHSATGAAISIASMEILLDLVPGATHIWMCRTLRTDLMGILSDSQASAGHPQVHYEGMDELGKQIEMYAGARIQVVERMDDGSTILGFDEDPGDTTSDTASIYVARVGQDGFFGVQGVRGPTDSRRISEDFSNIAQRGRSEWYTNIFVAHPRAVARSYGYTS